MAPGKYFQQMRYLCLQKLSFFFWLIVNAFSTVIMAACTLSFLVIVFNIRTPDCRSGDVVEHQLSDHKQMGGKNRKRLTPGKFGLLYYSLYAVKPIPYQAGKNQRHTGQGFYLA